MEQRPRFGLGSKTEELGVCSRQRTRPQRNGANLFRCVLDDQNGGVTNNNDCAATTNPMLPTTSHATGRGVAADACDGDRW